jgi:hypothetical protein
MAGSSPPLLTCLLLVVFLALLAMLVIRLAFIDKNTMYNNQEAISSSSTTLICGQNKNTLLSIFEGGGERQERPETTERQETTHFNEKERKAHQRSQGKPENAAYIARRNRTRGYQLLQSNEERRNQLNNQGWSIVAQWTDNQERTLKVETRFSQEQRKALTDPTTGQPTDAFHFFIYTADSKTLLWESESIFEKNKSLSPNPWLLQLLVDTPKSCRGVPKFLHLTIGSRVFAAPISSFK